jgi:calcineurin-like phosphoesterase family protein
MSNIWFSSDSHFSHYNIIAYCKRPYYTIHEMNKGMTENWNAVIKNEDIVYYLGDFSLSERVVPEILPKLNGKKILVVGNHDSAHPSNRKYKGAIERYLSYGFSEIHEQLELDDFILCHFPYAYKDGDASKDRYAAWRPKDNGQWLLCGHEHERFKVRDKQINVGVDAWEMKPVSFDALKEIRDKGII